MKVVMMMKTPLGNPILFDHIFFNQTVFQARVTKINGLPIDNIGWFSYHMQAMQEELGEVLKADKRWKTHRNTAFDPENKAEELADVFITAINLAIFSGIDAQMMLNAITYKQAENERKRKLAAEQLLGGTT